MGIGLSTAQVLLELYNEQKLTNVKNVAEIGAQELHLKEQDLQDLYEQVGLDKNLTTKHENLKNWPKHPRATAKNLYSDLGIKDYTSIDISAEHNSLKVDLNNEFLDKSYYNKFDLVTDFGSCEHVFNVAECYKTIHKITKKNGLIIICQAVYGGNGYFTFDKPFLEGIAAANNYEIIHSSYTVSSSNLTKNGSAKQYNIPLSKDLLDTLKTNKDFDCGINMVLKKKHDAEFKTPYQGNLLKDLNKSYGFKRVFNKDDLTESFIPVYDIKNVSFKILLKEFFLRIKKKLNLK